MAKPATVDSVVPRGKAAFHAALPGIAYFVSFVSAPAAIIILGATAIAMVASVVGGPSFSVIGKLFNKSVRPALKLKTGTTEEAAPHRFAEAIGAGFLSAAAVAFAVGAYGVGEALALIVVALAILNAAAGICVGCQVYLLLKRGQSKVTA